MYESVLDGTHYWLIRARDLGYDQMVKLLATIPGTSIETQYGLDDVAAIVTKGNDKLILVTNPMADGIIFHWPEAVPKSPLLNEIESLLNDCSPHEFHAR